MSTDVTPKIKRSTLCVPVRVACLLDQKIVALREELSVMNRLARAQDRKFEGSQGHALSRRLWLAEEELRLARSTISTLGAEVIRLHTHVRFPLLAVMCFRVLCSCCQHQHVPPPSPPWMVVRLIYACRWFELNSKFSGSVPAPIG